MRWSATVSSSVTGVPSVLLACPMLSRSMANHGSTALRSNALRGCLDPVDQLARAALVRVVQYDDELVTAGPGHHVLRAALLGEQLPDAAQYLVTAGMSVAVVDDLQVVDVDRQHCDRSAGVERHAHPLVQGTPVAHTGQRILACGTPLGVVPDRELVSRQRAPYGVQAAQALGPPASGDRSRVLQSGSRAGIT